jgi:pilus assembly protein CpaF
MPVLKSLKNPVTFSRTDSDYRYGVQPVARIVSDITYEILKDKPMLLLNTRGDALKQRILRGEIIRILDKGSYFAGITREDLLQRIYNYMFGYGELQPYLDNDDISDVDGTAYDQFSAVIRGKRHQIDIDMGDIRNFETYCRLIAVRNGGILNENDSHCRVSDANSRLRINLSIPPRNISGPAISIRKHRRKSYSYNDLIELGMLDSNVLSLLREASEKNRTVLFCGKGAAGKTTIMRAFINSLDPMERVLVVESDSEIYPEKKFCIQQRVKKINEGGNHVTLDMLVRDGLTMSLDTYCIGEIVGPEAYDFIKASCSGHRMVATVHSDSAGDSILRMAALASGARIQESEKTLYEMLSSGINLIIYLNSFKVDEIIEIIGFNPDKQRPVCRTLYKRRQE